MRPHHLALLLVLGLTFMLLAGTASAQETAEPRSSIMVTGYHVSPEALMQKDIGTITVTVKNMELLESVKITDASLTDRDLKVLSKPYVNIGSLGPGESLTLSFTIQAGFEDGIFYPKLLVDAEAAENVRYQIPVKVVSTSLAMGLQALPEEIVKDERAHLELLVGNSRPNTVTGVKISTADEQVIPSEVFLGALPSDESTVAEFEYTPQSTGTQTIHFVLEFRNGDNRHATTLDVPVTVTESKKSAELILTGIEVEPLLEPSGYKITGDINNAGLEEARSVVMKLGEAAGIAAIDPYKTYFVGLLESDDFSSFELDIAVEGDVTAVPLLIEYKDEDGNLFSQVDYVSIEHREQAQNPDELPLPLIGALVVIAVFVVGMIVYSWKKR
jgi:hypothetical protein